jgi:hypothetical protein
VNRFPVSKIQIVLSRAQLQHRSISLEYATFVLMVFVLILDVGVILNLMEELPVQTAIQMASASQANHSA